MRRKDPVCGMTVEQADAAGAANYGSATYYFCSETCLDVFRRDPGRFPSTPDEEGLLPSMAPEIGPTPPARTKRCPYCGSEARGLDGPTMVGDLSLGEFTSIVRGEWRRRLGPTAYTRDHSEGLIRVLLLCALEPHEPAHATAAEQQLARAVAALPPEGERRSLVLREMRALSSAFWDVLSSSNMAFDQATAVMVNVDRRLPWHLAG